MKKIVIIFVKIWITFRLIFPLLIFFACVTIFFYHSLLSNKGFYSGLQLKKTLQMQRESLNDLEFKKKRMQMMIFLMKNEDLDIVEESIRRVLRYKKSDDYLISN